VLKRVDHIGIVVRDLEAARRFFEAPLGLEIARELKVPGRPDRSLFYRCGDVDIELIEVANPEDREKRLQGSVARIEHIAFEVGDVEATIALLARAGVETTAPVRLVDRVNTWTVAETSGGVMYQLVQEDPE
jgi:methylmalonyl-CoA/ethylmalonyl-CoA epimerase